MLLALLLACSTPEAQAPTCEPTTCPELAAECGPVDDGCGGTLECGTCADSWVCNEVSVCEEPCTPMAAVFFDLGGTLVLEQESGLFTEAPDARALVEALRDQDTPVGVITNVERGWTIEDLSALLEDPTILELFDVVLLSSEAESRPKPDPRIYAEALALLPVPPPIEQTAFVTEEIDDIADAEPPSRGARGAGMIGVHVSDDAPDALADHTVATDALLSIASAPWVECIEAE